MVRQTAHLVWEGSIARGSGVVRGASGATGEIPFDLPNRLGEAEGKSTPEELLAAAHAACFTMTLGSILARERTPPERLEVDATCVLDPTEGARRITAVELEVRGHVPAADQEAFARAAKEAEERCVVSRALADSVEIRATATLR